jgi:hypothetical protein
LRDVHCVVTQNNPESKEVRSQLVKRGGEAHGVPAGVGGMAAVNRNFFPKFKLFCGGGDFASDDEGCCSLMGVAPPQSGACCCSARKLIPLAWLFNFGCFFGLTVAVAKSVQKNPRRSGEMERRDCVSNLAWHGRAGRRAQPLYQLATPLGKRT